MKKTRKELNALHRNPLPVELSVDTRGDLPLVNVSNGISWLWLWIRVACMYLSSPPRRPKIRILIEGLGTLAVRDAQDMRRAWNNGFFGKGTLSRLEPTFAARVTSQTKSSEAVTSERRRKRREFKELRAQFQRLETEERRRPLSVEERLQMEQLKEKMAEASAVTITNKAEQQEQQLVSGELENLEFLQLDPLEAFFLVFALEAGEVVRGSGTSLSCLEVLRNLALRSETEPSQCITNITRENVSEETSEEVLEGLRSFLQTYVVYHHYRSLGWCVRSGIKFGCDFLLYKRGPPFHHAEFGVLISSAKDKRVWEDTMAVARVVGGVKKTLVFAYVEVPTLDKLGQVWNGNENGREKIVHLLQLFKVCEMVYKRWSPSRTRE